jgi:hypothetical protein
LAGEFVVMSIKTVAARIALGLAVSGALAAAPVAAGGRYGGYHGGYYGGGGYYNNGNVFGAVVGTAVALGFIAAIASASQPKTTTVVAPQPAYAPVYPQQSYQQQAPVVQQQAVDPSLSAAGAQAEMCARAAERTAQNYGGFARTVSIDSISGEQANAVIRGTLEINPNNGQPVNRAAFTCTATYGQVTGVQLG